MYNDNRKTYEFLEDWEDNPAGRAMLKMPWMWGEGEYPQKKEQTTPETSFLPAVETSGMVKPQPDLSTLPAMTGHSDSSFGVDTLKKTLRAPDTADMTQTYSNNFAGLKPRPDALQAFTRSQAVKSDTPQPIPFPYKDMGQLAKPASDKAITYIVEPAIQKLKQTVQDKEPAELFPETVTGENWTPIKDRQNVVATPEADLFNTTSVAYTGIKDGINNAYTKENLAKAMSAARNGKTLGYEDNINNPDPDATKGLEKTLRRLRLSAKEVEYLGHQFFDPEGKYHDHQGLKNWMDNERKEIEAIKTIDLSALDHIDWKNNPDQGLKLAGKWFRESFVGEHLPGLAIEVAKSPMGAAGGQAIGILGGMAQFYARSDELMESIILGGATGSAVESWNFMVGEFSRKLSPAQRATLLMLNNHLSEEIR